MLEEELLKRLAILKEQAFMNATPNLALLKEIKGSLFKISKNKRDFLKPFVQELRKKLFESSTSIPGLDFEDFFTDSNSEVVLDNTETIEVAINDEEVEITFDELLKNLLICIQSTVIDLKGYAILKLSNQDYPKKYKIKVLYDDNYFYDPITKKITKKFDECDAISIEKFSNEIQKGIIPDTNLLCLVLLTSKIKNTLALESTKSALSIIVDSFDEFEYCTIKEFGNYQGKFYKRAVEKESFFDEIEYVTSKFLSNGKIDYEEEKIIKKTFKDFSSPVLSYKLLKSGNSGAKVVEVRPVKAHTIGQYDRRFIVKFSKIDKERKIKKESKNFSDFIKSFEGSDEYRCTYFETNIYEALKYDFAKSSSSINSYSFAQILDDPKNEFSHSPHELINEIFKVDIFSIWKEESLEKHKVYVRDLYLKYVNLEKIKNQVLIINGIAEPEFNQSEFKLNLDKLLNYELEINKKICHGDLHSENFFKDDKGRLFLIDFGHTNIEHSIIDHTSLECSIKFKHIPKYIKLDILLRIEDELLLDESFNSSFVLKEAVLRNDLLKYCEIIKQIRFNSIEFIINSNSKTEYYISLFFMTYRQVGYSDMNQLYALESAKKILNKIIIDLGL